MDNKTDLKLIWGKLNDLQIEVGELINTDIVEDAYSILKKEQALQKKWTPWMIPYILIVMSFFTWITNATDSIISMIGIFLITIGGFIMTYLLQSNQVPIERYEHNRDATEFMRIVKDKLARRKHFWAIGVAIYTLSLLFGLHLLIFGVDSLAGKGGELGLLYGTMLGLTGFVTGSMFLAHQKRYGNLLKRIDQFLTE